MRNCTAVWSCNSFTTRVLKCIRWTPQMNPWVTSLSLSSLSPLRRTPMHKYFRGSLTFLTSRMFDRPNGAPWDLRHVRLENGIRVVSKKATLKLFVPMSLRQEAIKKAHEVYGHTGTKKVLSVLSPPYYWLTLIGDVSVFLKHCDTCQKCKKKTEIVWLAIISASSRNPLRHAGDGQSGRADRLQLAQAFYSC